MLRAANSGAVILSAAAIALAGCTAGSGEAPIEPSTASARQSALPAANSDGAAPDTTKLDTTLQAEAAKPDPNSKFIGRYNGGSFETAMGMEIAADGTFGWGLSVGALDMSAKGTWEQEGEVIILTSTPKPVPPEFRWLGLAPARGDRLVSVVRPNGKPFTYLDVKVECADGSTTFQQVVGDTASYETDRPIPKCDRPVAVTVAQSNYDITSPRYDLAELGWEAGQLLMLEFQTNDMGVADFTGMIGNLDANVLKFVPSRGSDQRLGALELRKLQPRPPSQPTTSDPAAEAP